MGIQINGQTDTVTSTTAGGSVKVTPLAASTGLNVGTGASISSPATNILTLGTNNSERVRIGSTGSVGIGTNESYGDSNASFTSLSLGGNGTRYGLIELNKSDGIAGSWIDCYGTGGNGDLRITTAGTSGAITFWTGGEFTEKVRISSSGNLGIGTTNPSSLLHLSSTTAPQLNVQAPASGGADSQLRISSSAGNYRRIIFYDSAATPTKNNFEIAVQEVDNSLFFGPSTAVGGLTFSGSTGLVIDSSGRTTIPSQPSILITSTSASGAQTFSSSVYTKVTVWNDTVHTRGLSFDGTNKRVNIPVTGHYMVYAKINYDTQATGGNDDMLMIYKNGAGYGSANLYYNPQGGRTVYYLPFTVNQVVSCAANDYLEIWFNNSSGANRSLYGQFCYWYVYLLG